MLRASDYDVDPEYGFLTLVPQSLPSYFDPWLALCRQMRDMSDQQMEEAISNLPAFLEERLVSDTGAVKSAYALLSFIVSGYVWKNGENNPKIKIPSKLAVPYVSISNKLGISPILTHASVDLYNWHLKDVNAPFSLENIEINYTFTKLRDEEWFYKIHIMMEKIGGGALKQIIELANIILAGEKDGETMNHDIHVLLVTFKDHIKQISALISRMREYCDPKIFFESFRPYLDGWKDTKKFPQGLLYEGVGYFVLGGGSAAQSSLIQAFDRILGIFHTDEYSRKFLAEMLNYMPEKHRKFLLALEEHDIKPYVYSYCDFKVITAYNDCISALEELRKIHLGLARQYVIKPIRERKNSLKGLKENQSETEEDDEAAFSAIGTGGTQIKHFLDATLKQTKESKI